VVRVDVQLKGQLCQTVTVFEPSTALNDYGEPTYSTGAALSARVIGRQAMIRDASGQQVVSDRQLVTESAISPSALIRLSGESTALSLHPVRAVAERITERGASDHWKAWL